jgi:predicted alpha/beta hydrolase family esterase
MARILVIPGLGGSGPEHWQTWLERSFADAARVEQDDWDRPHRHKWITRLFDAVAESPGAVLVAHSLGCILVAHAALEYPDLPIDSALLVAPADVDSAAHTPDHLRSFARIPQLPLPFPAVTVASTNDPYMELCPGPRVGRSLDHGVRKRRAAWTYQRRRGLRPLDRRRGDRAPPAGGARAIRPPDETHRVRLMSSAARRTIAGRTAVAGAGKRPGDVTPALSPASGRPPRPLVRCGT